MPFQDEAEALWAYESTQLRQKGGSNERDEQLAFFPRSYGRIQLAF